MLLLRLEREMATFTKSQRRVADYIICDPMLAAFSTIDKIAHATKVSTTTVVRLATALGYDGFSDFQNDLREQLRATSAPLDKLAINRVVLKEPENSLTALTNMLLGNISETYNRISSETIQEVAKKVVEARHIYVTACRSSMAFSSYLAFNFDRMFAKADLLDPNINSLVETMRRVTKEDVAIVCTLSRYNRTTTKVAEYAKKNGATVVVIADSYDSPLAEFADHQIVAFCKTNDFHNSQLSPIYIADVFIHYCSKLANEEVRENLTKSEQYIKDLNVMLRK